MEALKTLAEKIRVGDFVKALTNSDRVVAASDDTAPCMACNGTRTEIVIGRGARPCTVCRPQVDRIALIRESIPERYREASLDTLEPRPDLHPDQPALIAYMKEHPELNYYLCGRNDTGKTHMLYALYDHAARAGRRVFAASLFEMVEAAKRSMRGGGAMDTAQIGKVSVEELKTTRWPHSIFIDDVDKARPTEYVAELFFDYVETIYKRNHQLVATSQLEPQDLIDHFERADPRYGVAITRRIVNDETAIWRMF